MWRGVSIGVVAWLLGCPAPVNPPADRCVQVRCTGSDVCDPSTGACVSPPRDAGVDAGAGDAGALDAGAVDAGALDGGLPDAGGGDAGALDAGPGDAGARDAGLLDAGCGSDAECFGGLARCEPRSRACVECTEDAHCFSSVAPRCDLRVFQCVECVGGAHCENPLPVCDAQQCVPCQATAECGAGRECTLATGACTPLNDTCASARAILPSGTGSLSITGEPGQALDDTAGTCNAAGPELVYAFTTTTVRALTVSVAPLGASLARPVVYLRSGCTGTQVGCDAPVSGAASLSVPALPAGSYFLFVESANGAPGRVTLDVSLQPPPTGAANDTCAGALQLSVNGTTQARAVAVGDTALGSNGSVAEPSCSATARSSGKDLVYAYTLAARSNVSVVARPLSGSALHPVVSVRTPCDGAGTELGCQAASAATAIQLQLAGQAAGPAFVHVDSADGTEGAFQLEVEAFPTVDNDACSGAQALAFTGATATATGDTTYATNGNVAGDQSPSCSDSARGTGRDVVFSYTLPQPRDVTVAVTPTGASPTFEPVASVRASCTDGSRTGELACASPLAPTAARVSLVNQPAGTYTVWVDSARDTAGPFQLEVVTAAPTPPPANDSCASPEALVFAGDVATVSGSTAQASNSNFAGDVSPTCAASAKQAGRDVVYSFTLTQPQDVTLVLAPASGSPLTPALYVRRSSCTSQLLADEVFCDTRPGPVEAHLTSLAAGTYFVFVDSSGGTAGAFTLTATRSPATAAPPNDWCPGAQALAFVNNVATASGTTVGATNGNLPIDNAPACGTDFFPRRFGRDLVYSYTLPGAYDVELEVTPGAGSALAPVLYVRAPNQCASFSAGHELACVAESGPRALREVLPNQVAGTYFVFVDSNSVGMGAFTLTVTRRTATLPPPHDTCANPAVLPLGLPGVAGDTSVARNDYSSLHYASACRWRFFDGRELVYQVTPAATGPLTVTLTPEGTFDAALLLFTGSCGPAQCARAVDQHGRGVPESLTFDAVQGQPAWLVVDSADRSLPGAFGRFTLTAQ